jgi:hypothetical protein
MAMPLTRTQQAQSIKHHDDGAAFVADHASREIDLFG